MDASRRLRQHGKHLDNERRFWVGQGLGPAISGFLVSEGFSPLMCYSDFFNSHFSQHTQVPIKKSFLTPEIWQYRFPEQPGLPGTIVSPDFQHDVSAAGIAVLFNSMDTFFRRPGNGTHLT